MLWRVSRFMAGLSGGGMRCGNGAGRVQMQSGADRGRRCGARERQAA